MERELQQIHEIVIAFSKEIAPDVTPQLGTDFAYFWETEVAEYAICVAENSSQSFYNFLVNRARIFYKMTDFPDLDIFVISYLHEIGHHYTEDEALFLDDLRQRQVLDKLNSNTDSEILQARIRKMYHKLPSEILATDWAINFIYANMAYCIEWNTKLCATFQQVFSALGVSNDD